jgi:hypothetical protein
MIDDVIRELGIKGLSMPDNESGITVDKRLRTPLEALRMDKTAFSVVSLHEADALDKEFWRKQSPASRLQALELMRQVMYGYDPLSDRVQRVIRAIKRTPG